MHPRHITAHFLNTCFLVSLCNSLTTVLYCLLPPLCYDLLGTTVVISQTSHKSLTILVFGTTMSQYDIDYYIDFKHNRYYLHHFTSPLGRSSHIHTLQYSEFSLSFKTASRLVVWTILFPPIKFGIMQLVTTLCFLLVNNYALPVYYTWYPKICYIVEVNKLSLECNLL